MIDIIITFSVILSIIGTGGIVCKFYCTPRIEQQVQEQHDMGDTIDEIIEDHIQRNSEDSETEIKIHIHTHHKEKEELGNK